MEKTAIRGSSTFLDVDTGNTGSIRERRRRRPSSSYQSTSAANSFSSTSPTPNRLQSNRTPTSGLESTDTSEGSKSDEDDEARESSSAKSRLGDSEDTLTARKIQQWVVLIKDMLGVKTWDIVDLIVNLVVAIFLGFKRKLRKAA